MAVYGVDVHDGYQQGLSFPTLHAQGYRFCAVKLTEGTGYVRDRAAAWIRAARAAGLIPGAYHWLTSSPGDAQARWFWSNLKQAGGPAGMLIQLDCEDNADWSDVQAWAAEWRRLSKNYPFLIYTGGWWWRPRGWPGNTITPYLWDSHYLSADTDSLPDDPAAFAARIPPSWWTPGYGGWTTATLLQFTSRGDAGNLGNNVDLNVYRGSLDQLRATFVRPLVEDLVQGGDDDMRALIRWSGSPAVFLTDGVASRWVRTEAELRDLQTLHTAGTLPLGNKGQVQVVERQALVGRIIGPLPAEFGPEFGPPNPPVDPIALTAALTAAVVAHPDLLQRVAVALAEQMPQPQMSGTWQADDATGPNG